MARVLRHRPRLVTPPNGNGRKPFAELIAILEQVQDRRPEFLPEIVAAMKELGLCALDGPGGSAASPEVPLSRLACLEQVEATLAAMMRSRSR
jgi:hypothetical protein